MPAPDPGKVRVLPHAHVGRLRPGVWTDIDANLPGLHDWVSMGLVTTDEPPDDLPSRRCCGLDA